MKSPPSKHLHPTAKPAYALIFALIFMTFFMIVVSGVSEKLRESLATQRDQLTPMKAEAAAKSAADLGQLAMKEYEPGYNIPLTEEEFAKDTDGDGTIDTYGNFQVYATAQENDGDWYTPIPGTGSAGDSDLCRTSDADHDGDFEIDKSIDHPCNWNRLAYGDTAIIPLFASDGLTTDGTLNPAALDLSRFTLRLRTPCTNGSLVDPDCARPDLDDGDGSLEQDSSLVFWQILGEKADGTSLVVIPNDAKVSDARTGESIRNSSLNTEIYESLVNDHIFSMDYEVFTLSDSINEDIHALILDEGIERVALQLNIVTPLKNDEDGSSIPYLEWQTVSNSLNPIADNKSILWAEGWSDGMGGSYYFSRKIVRDTIGAGRNVYTLSN
jgi:hypothetical protein